MPKSITIQTKNIPEILLAEIEASENKSGTLAELLNELSSLRYIDPQDDNNELNGQVQALTLDLGGLQRELKVLRARNAELAKKLQTALDETRTQRGVFIKSEALMRMSQASASKEMRDALSNAVSLISYLNEEHKEEA